MLKTSRQTPATNRVLTQLRRRLKRRRPRPRPTITSPSSSPISTSSRSPPLAAPADAACDSADRRPRRPRSSTTRRPCGGGDAALAMAAADVAVACLHEKAGRGRAPGRAAQGRRAAADATLSCGATRALSKTPSRRVSAASPRRRLAVVAPPPECRPHAAVRLRAAAPLLDPKYTPIRSTSTTFLIPQHLARRTRTYRSTTAGPGRPAIIIK